MCIVPSLFIRGFTYDEWQEGKEGLFNFNVISRGRVKRSPEERNSDLNYSKEPSNNWDKDMAHHKGTLSIHTTVAIRTRKGINLKSRRGSAFIDHFGKLDREVDLAELNTDQEQGREEHKNRTGVLVGDVGFLAPDRVEVGDEEDDGSDDNGIVSPVILVCLLTRIETIRDLVYEGDQVCIEGDGDAEVKQCHEDHHKAQAEDRRGHDDDYVRFGWCEGKGKEERERRRVGTKREKAVNEWSDRVW